MLYAIIVGWPGSRFTIKNVQPGAGSKIYMLGYRNPLKWKTVSDGITINLPDELQNEGERPCKQAFTFKIEGRQKM